MLCVRAFMRSRLLTNERTNEATDGKAKLGRFLIKLDARILLHDIVGVLVVVPRGARAVERVHVRDGLDLGIALDELQREALGRVPADLEAVGLAA